MDKQMTDLDKKRDELANVVSVFPMDDVLTCKEFFKAGFDAAVKELRAELKDSMNEMREAATTLQITTARMNAISEQCEKLADVLAIAIDFLERPPAIATGDRAHDMARVISGCKHLLQDYAKFKKEMV